MAEVSNLRSSNRGT